MLMNQAFPIPCEDAASLLLLDEAEFDSLPEGVRPWAADGAYPLVPLVHGYVSYLRRQAEEASTPAAKRFTQAQIAEHLDISERRVRELASEWAIDSRELSLDAWRVRYLRHLREMAAGRAAAGDLDLAEQRARLAKEQADRIAMQNALTRKELAPAEVIEEVLSKAGARAAKLLDTIPGEFKRRCPQLAADDIAAIAGIIAKVRNIAAGISLANLADDEEGDQADAASREREEAATDVLLDGGLGGER